MTPIEFMQEYERRTNTHIFQNVAPLIADDALYWFNDGSFHSVDEIRQAFEKTWDVIQVVEISATEKEKKNLLLSRISGLHACGL